MTEPNNPSAHDPRVPDPKLLNLPPGVSSAPAGEEIDLGMASAGAATRPPAAEDVQDFGPRVGILEELIGPTMTDQQLVDAIIQAPEEKLIPWENCKLPSLGLFYGWDSPFCQVRAMGQAAEKILATQRLAQSGQSIDYLFRECCRFVDPNFDPLDLLAGDRVYLLYYLRGITHGNIYEFAVTCQRPDCQQTSTHAYDLNQLATTIRWADPALGSEPFRVQLPYLTETLRRDVWVGLRFLRGRDLNNMTTMRRTRKKLFAAPAIRAGRQQQQQQQQRPNAHTEPTIDDTLTENLQMVIDNVMGVKDRSKIAAFVQRMHATDTAAIREWLRDNSPGIETTITMTCPECGQEFVTELPITESFFRPTQKRGA